MIGRILFACIALLALNVAVAKPHSRCCDVLCGCERGQTTDCLVGEPSNECAIRSELCYFDLWGSMSELCDGCGCEFKDFCDTNGGVVKKGKISMAELDGVYLRIRLTAALANRHTCD